MECFNRLDRSWMEQCLALPGAGICQAARVNPGDYRGIARSFAVLFRGAVRGFAVVLVDVSIDWNVVGWSNARCSRAQESAGQHG